MDQWYVARGKVKTGPFFHDQMQAAAGEGGLRPTDMVLQTGGQRWVAAREVPGLFPAPAARLLTAIPVAVLAPACPKMDGYEQLLSGHLPDAEKEALLDHLEHCDSCAGRLTALPEPDTLVDMIRQARTLGDGASEETISDLVERLSKLRPDGTGAEAEPTPPPHDDTPAPPVNGVPTLALSAAGSRVAVLTEQGQTIDHPKAGVKKKSYDFLAPAQAPDEMGRLGPYRVLQVLGAGGMGVVFRAEDPQLARPVALKAMLPALAGSDNARERFLREARAAASIKHDHIVAIYQVGEDRGVPFLAMELLDGESLDARLQREGKIAPAEVIRIGREIALGLAAAHKRGLIHRDIKPPNIWLEDRSQESGVRGQESGVRSQESGVRSQGSGTSPQTPDSCLLTPDSCLLTPDRVKILDFGLARGVGEEAQLTLSGAIVGTPAYMAPERGKLQGVDHRCDLFSLGCVMYRMATGAAPFQGTDIISTLMAVATENPKPPDQLDPGLPPGLSKLIMDLLAKSPDARPASAAAVADTLDRLTRGWPTRPGDPHTSTVAISTTRRFPAPRRPWRAAAMTAVTLALLLPLGYWLSGVIVRIRTPEGVLVVAVNEPGADVSVDGDKAVVTWDEGKKKAEIKVKPGTEKVRVKVMKAGFEIVNKEVTLEENGRTVFNAKLIPNPPPAMPRADEPAAKSADGFVRLFNGKDLTGWKVVGKSEAFVVLPAEKAFAVKPTPVSWLQTERDYTDFHLRFDFRIVTKNANSGMSFRMPPDVGGLQMEVQIRDDSTPYPLSQTGGIYWSKDSRSHLKREREELLNPFGEWNRMEVIARGPQVRIVVNDKQALLADLSTVAAKPSPLVGVTRASGRIGFNADRGEVWYRNIEIKELPLQPAPSSVDPKVRQASIRYGDWKIDGAELVQQSPKGGALHFGAGDWGDYNFNCETMVVDGNPEHGLPFRISPQGSEVFFLGGWGNKESCATTMLGGKIGKQRRRPNGGATKGDWNRLSIRVRGRHCECYRDGELVLQYDDIPPNHLRGAVGLYTHGEARFRNLRVTDPTGKLLFDGLPEAPEIK